MLFNLCGKYLMKLYLYTILYILFISTTYSQNTYNLEYERKDILKFGFIWYRVQHIFSVTEVTSFRLLALGGMHKSADRMFSYFNPPPPPADQKPLFNTQIRSTPVFPICNYNGCIFVADHRLNCQILSRYCCDFAEKFLT